METQISLAGNVGTEVEFSAGPDWNLARFRIATTPSWRKGGEWVSGETLWMTVRVAGQTALNVRDSVHKGDPLVVVGRVRHRVWQGSDGQRKEADQIEASSLGHDMSRGVSRFIRPEKAPFNFDDDPLVPDGVVPESCGVPADLGPSDLDAPDVVDVSDDADVAEPADGMEDTSMS